MPYCPECQTEYVEGATRCLDCGAALKPGPPPPSNDEKEEPNARFVPVRVFQGLHAQFQAELARNVLEEEGIPSSIVGNLGAELLPGADVVQLLVREEDRERASQVVEAFLESNAEQAEPLDDDEDRQD
ncbi:MAG TPA: DUF2007 domain-containing protein [Terriglobia bacterium]|nr:DUF2007 domain-containing protein [Terriglobia bacterium]